MGGLLFGRTLLGDSLIFGDYLETRDLARATKLGLFFCSVRLRLWADCGRTDFTFERSLSGLSFDTIEYFGEISGRLVSSR